MLTRSQYINTQSVGHYNFNTKYVGLSNTPKPQGVAYLYVKEPHN